MRTYTDAVIYAYPSLTFLSNLDLPTEMMGESISAVPGRRAVWAGSEGLHSPVWIVPLPVFAAGGRVTSPSRPPQPVAVASMTQSMQRVSATMSSGSIAGNIATRIWLRPSLR